jgi:hypothetical protein
MKLFQLKSGFATLPTIITLSALILIAAIGIAAATQMQTETNATTEQSSVALSYAEAGAKDALIRITRNKNYTCATADCYSLDMMPSGCLIGYGCAKISVSAGTGAAGNPKIVTAKGIVQNKTRELEAQVFYDVNGYGEISNVVWQELTN